MNLARAVSGSLVIAADALSFATFTDAKPAPRPMAGPNSVDLKTVALNVTG